MKNIRYLAFLSVVLFLQSCIPVKKLVYLQEDGSKIKAGSSLEYRFKINDLIYIDIKTRDENLNKLFKTNTNTNNINTGNLYFTGYKVDNNGFIEIPVLGKIKASGKTSKDIKTEIERFLLNNYFKHKQDVYVTVKPGGILVSVLGEVKKPGRVTILKEKPNIFEAIAQANDITLTGDRTDVMIIREKPDGTKVIGHIDLTKKNVLNSPFFYLENNDIVYIKPLPQKTIGTGTTFVNTLSTIMGLTSFIISIYLLTRK
jgi:polysaccharide export outer membrane protein